MKSAGVFEEIQLSSLPDIPYVELDATRLQKLFVVSISIINWRQLNRNHADAY